MKSKIKLLYIYKYASVGGVEKVILSRAFAFKNNNMNVITYIYMFYDLGGLEYFKVIINKYNLGDYLIILNKLPLTFNDFDFIFINDTPEVIERVKKANKVIIECHTHYPENREYLKHLPSWIRSITVPSKTFCDVIKNEVPEMLVDSIYVLRNYVKLFGNNNIDCNYAFLNKIPLLYLGRIDHFKNILETIDIFIKAQETFRDNFILVLVGGYFKGSFDLLEIIKNKGIMNRVIYLPPINYDKVPMLLSLVKRHKGIFISSSKGESFGLSVGESILMNLPVLLSDIPAHRYMVDSDSSFTYKLGNIDDAVNKLEYIISNYDTLSERLNSFKIKLLEEAFLEDWGNFINNIYNEYQGE